MFADIKETLAISASPHLSDRICARLNAKGAVIEIPILYEHAGVLCAQV